MNQQTDIADILGTMSNGAMVGGHKSKVEELLKHFAGGGAHTGHMRGQTTSWPQSLDPKAVCLPAVVEISRLLPAPHEAKEGGEGMSGFAEQIEARLAIINKMIPGAKLAERRSLQKERSDLEAKLQKVRA